MAKGPTKGGLEVVSLQEGLTMFIGLIVSIFTVVISVVLVIWPAAVAELAHTGLSTATTARGCR
jgi:hypothetical protein